MTPMKVPPSPEGFAPTREIVCAGVARSRWRPWSAPSNGDLARTAFQGYYAIKPAGSFRAACAELLDWREGRLPFPHRDEGLHGILARIPLAERHALIAYGVRVGWWSIGMEPESDEDAEYCAMLDVSWGLTARPFGTPRFHDPDKMESNRDQ